MLGQEKPFAADICRGPGTAGHGGEAGPLQRQQVHPILHSLTPELACEEELLGPLWQWGSLPGIQETLSNLPAGVAVEGMAIKPSSALVLQGVLVRHIPDTHDWLVGCRLCTSYGMESPSTTLPQMLEPTSGTRRSSTPNSLQRVSGR